MAGIAGIVKPKLSEAHLAAINRQRRIVVNFDASYAVNTALKAYPDLSELVAHLFAFADAENSCIDSIWWNWCEGNQVPYPSKFLPLFDHPAYRLVVRRPLVHPRTRRILELRDPGGA